MSKKSYRPEDAASVARLVALHTPNSHKLWWEEMARAAALIRLTWRQVDEDETSDEPAAETAP